MMFSIIYFLKRRCDISAFSTEFLLWVVLSAQLQGEILRAIASRMPTDFSLRSLAPLI
jgi:hypothetical protein